MRSFALMTFLLTLLAVVCVAQGPAHSPDAKAIRQAALDYADGFYSGVAARMEQAIHFDLNKAFPRFIARTGRCALAYTTYSQLIELTRAKVGLLPDTARHLAVKIVHVEDGVAIAKVTSANFNDYLQLMRLNDQWKIVNVLWNGGPANTARLKDFKGNDERAAVELAAMNFVEAAQSADARRLAEVIDPDFSRATLIAAPQTGRQYVQRARHEGLMENTYARIGRTDEEQRDNRAEMLDVMDGLAVARVETPVFTEYLQLFKSGSEWKVSASILVPKVDVSLTRLLPAIPGEAMFDFTLPVYGGGTFTLSKHKGKNVLLMFPRGAVGNGWCSYCPYQYLELDELERAQKIRSKYNVEIVYVLPYSSERIADWYENFPDAMQTVERLKNPGENAGSLQKELAAWVSTHYPKGFKLEKGKIPAGIPVLVDADRTLSKQLKVFTTFWDNAQSEQNVASFFIVDKKGVLQYKHIGQMTEDRPSVEFILEQVKKLR